MLGTQRIPASALLVTPIPVCVCVGGGGPGKMHAANGCQVLTRVVLQLEARGGASYPGFRALWKRWFGAYTLGLSPNTYIGGFDTLLGRKSKRERNGHVPRGVLISSQ